MCIRDSPNVTLGGIGLDETGVEVFQDEGFQYLPNSTMSAAEITCMDPDMNKTQMLDLQDLLPDSMKGINSVPQSVKTKGVVQFVMITQEYGRPDTAWELPDKKAFDNVIVRTQDLNTAAKNGANAAIAYSSVSGGVPIVGLRASKPQLLSLIHI